MESKNATINRNAHIASSVATVAGSAYMQYQNALAQADAAEKQNEYMQQNWLAEAEANSQAAQRQIDQLNIKQQQIADAGQEEMTLAEREAMAERARAIVAAFEAGVSGNLTKSILGELDLKRSEDLSAIEANTKAQMQQTQYEKKEARERGKTVGSGPANIVMRPSMSGAFIEGGLGIAGALASKSGRKNLATLRSTFRKG